MKINTSELTGAALDWAVAWAENITIKHFSGVFYLLDGDEWNPTRNWAQGGPIIEREEISVDRMGGAWTADITDSVGGYIEHTESGPTPLIAAMRCYVASKLGDEVEIPEELTA
jgi:hypothetical protein